MKRFYKKAEAGTAPGGYVIRLDGKMLKTPLQHNIITASKALAEAVAAEWEAQGVEIHPRSMPMMQLLNTMIDKSAGDERPDLEDEVIRYIGSDLVCYFGTHPADLVVRQEKCWRPLVEWMQSAHGIALKTVSGIQYVNQLDSTEEKFEKIVKKLGAADFTVMQAVTGLCGSAVIALALAQGHIDAEAAFQAAAVDEIYQLEKWGEDKIARDRLVLIRQELEAVTRFQKLIKSS